MSTLRAALLMINTDSIRTIQGFYPLLQYRPDSHSQTTGRPEVYRHVHSLSDERTSDEPLVEIIWIGQNINRLTQANLI